jgi:hypothetical protein
MRFYVDLMRRLKHLHERVEITRLGRTEEPMSREAYRLVVGTVMQRKRA